MKQVAQFFNIELLIIFFVVVVLTGCGGGGSEGGASGGGQGSSVAESVLHGSVGDGPIVNAVVRVFDKDNNLLGEQRSDNTANYQLSVRANRNDYPLLVEASGGQDIVTGAEPDFTLKSIVLTPANKKRVNINPFSTLIVEIAANLSGGFTSSNVDLAEQIVLEQMNFGFDQALMSDPITSGVDETNIAMIIRSSEALGEAIRRTRDALQVVEPGITANQVIASLAADMVDGVVDGNGAVGVDARVSAVVSVVSAQVLIEVMTGQLHVYSVDASSAMNNAVQVSIPNIGASTSVNDLPILSGMLMQSKVTLAAVQAVDVNPLFVTAKDALNNVQPGSQPADVAAVLPVDISQNLSMTLANLVVASDADLELVNNVVRSGGDEEPVSVNTVPTISGLPLTSIEEGSAYLFVPTASDADGDALSFSVTNLPAWANFSPESGAISGTPSALDVGVTSNIVLKVSDGLAEVSLPAFEITVTAFPNTVPTISGSPLTSIEEGSAYLFVPTASDADGDALSFSVTNLPTWANFSPESGAISGTPSALDVGVTSNIVLKVSDGIAEVSLPAFEIMVTALSNTAPTISGSPLTSIEEGSAYLFVPTASDADGDALSFSVTNLPAWASFNPASGAISGTPGALDVGITNNVLIKVSDGNTIAELPAFDISVSTKTASVGTATLSWAPPTENTDGSALSDLAGYKIYYGTTAGVYTSEITLDNPGLSSYVVDNLAGGKTYYFVITAFTTSGLESEYSTVGSKFIP